MKDPGWIGKGINGTNWDANVEFSSGTNAPDPVPFDREEEQPVLYVVENGQVIALGRRRKVGFIE